jgi:metal-sulfur cluster biosynthetic enzyme
LRPEGRAGDTPGGTHGAHSMFNDDPISPAGDPAAPASDAGAPAPVPASGESPQPAPGSGDAFVDLTLEQAKLALRRVKDPDLNLNIVDLGLVYDVRLIGKDVEVDMSLTSPGCPSGPEIMGDAERVLKALPGVGEVTINLVWTPFWSPERIEPRVRAYMGL